MINSKKEQDTSVITRINTDLLLGIKQSGQSNSDFIRDAIQEKLEKEDIDFIKEEMKHHQEDLKDCEQKIKLLQQKEKEKTNLPKKEILFLIETKKLLEQNPHFVDGRINFYINEFRKPYKYSKAEFFDLLQEAEIQDQEEKTLTAHDLKKKKQ